MAMLCCRGTVDFWPLAMRALRWATLWPPACYKRIDDRLLVEKVMQQPEPASKDLMCRIVSPLGTTTFVD